MPIDRGLGAIAAVIAMAMTAVPATASADTVTAPQVFVRLVDPSNATVGVTSWQPLSATLTSMGPYDIGVALQSTTAEYNRQAAQIDIVSEPGGPVPSNWSDNFDPYAPYCGTLAGAPGTIQDTGALLYFHGDGAYTLNVAMYTDAQHNAFPGNTCSGGPTSTVTLTVNASPTVRIAGTPMVPRTTRKAHGDNGPVLSMPAGAQGDKWRCARDPVVAPDGSVTGTATTGDSGTSGGNVTFPVQETDAFTGPGRWACAVQALSGDNGDNEFPTPWVTTPTVTVKGEFVRDHTRTALRRLGHGRMRLTIPAIKTVAAAAAHGRLTVTISRAQCVSVRKGTFRLHRVLSRRVTLDGAGRGSFTFTSPRQPGFYLGRVPFGGTALILPGPDANMYLGVFSPANFRAKPSIQFVDPSSWAACP
ncbi:MAG: hypothetical protein ACXVR1_18790 [Solirubrobacteraceae bacterium]